MVSTLFQSHFLWENGLRDFKCVNCSYFLIHYFGSGEIELDIDIYLDA